MTVAARTPAIELAEPTSRAELPANYEAARTALAECARIDECQQWADKAAALASYARQADDETLFKYATRIRDRAIRRSGELLLAVEPARGGDRRSDQWDGGVPLVSRESVATAAGLSERQRKTAIRIARVPEDDFERQVESDDPPSATELARQGTKPSTKRPASARARPSPQSGAASEAIRMLFELAGLFSETSPRELAENLRPDQLAVALALMEETHGWFLDLDQALREVAAPDAFRNADGWTLDELLGMPLEKFVETFLGEYVE